jgi:hypothetical protein
VHVEPGLLLEVLMVVLLLCGWAATRVACTLLAVAMDMMVELCGLAVLALAG